MDTLDQSNPDYYKHFTKDPAPDAPKILIKDDKRGRKYGRLTVLELAPLRKKTTGGTSPWRVYWRCQCDCGRIRDVKGSSLTSGKTQSCGCLRLDAIASKDPVGSFMKTFKDGAEKKGKQFLLSREQFEQLIFGACAYCGEEPSLEMKTLRPFKRSTIDRVDSSAGYTPENCVSSCHMCNMMKRHHSVENFLARIKRIFEYRGLEFFQRQA